jgi:hypothetical protein
MASVQDYKKTRAQDPASVLNALIVKSSGDVIQQIVGNIVSEMLGNKNTIRTIARVVLSNIRQPKDGTNGKDGEDGQNGHTPKRGIDYLTEDEVEEIINTAVRQAKPVKGIDYFTPEDISDIVQKAKPIAGVDYVLPQNGEKGDDGALIEGADIVARINGLAIDPRLQIDAKHIKNLPMGSGTKLSGGIARGGLKLVWQTQLSGDIDGINTVFTVPSASPTPKDSKYLVSARGVIKDSDSGDFVVSNNNRTITFTSAPPTGSARPRIPVYEAH